MVTVRKSSKSRVGFSVQLVFQLVQHLRDEQLMKNLREFLDCGNILLDREAVFLRVTNLSDICEKIIPLFDKYPLLGMKSKDYIDFVKILELVKTKKHLTTEGLNEINKIKAGMNRMRT